MLTINQVHQILVLVTSHAITVTGTVWVSIYFWWEYIEATPPTQQHAACIQHSFCFPSFHPVQVLAHFLQSLSYEVAMSSRQQLSAGSPCVWASHAREVVRREVS